MSETMGKEAAGRPITGRHVAAVTVAAFGVIAAVNFVLAWQAVATFPGLEVQNGYVASQSFDADRAAQERLGWTLAAEHRDGMLRLAFTGADGAPVTMDPPAVLVGRPTEAGNDMRPVLIREGGVWTAPLALGRGKWMLMVEAVAADGTRFRQRLDLYVKG